MRPLIKLVGFLMAVGFASMAVAQTWPTKAIRIVVPFPPGGVADSMARTVGAQVAKQIGQSVVVENKAGASAIIGSDYVAKAAPDGYTILLANLPVLAINPIAYTGLPYDPIKDFVPISMIADQPYVIAVTGKSPARDLKELIALAKASPDTLTHGSASSSTHLATELFKMQAGIKMIHVPYKGSAPAINDLLGGQITMLIDPVISLKPHLVSGKLRGLAVTDEKPSDAVPDIPSYTKFDLKDLNMTSWQGLVAPAGTPKEIVARLNAEIVKALQDPDVRARMQAQGVTPVGNSPEAFSAFVKAEVDRWSKVATAVNFERQPLSGK